MDLRTKEYSPNVEDLDQDLRRSSVLLMPSRGEGFGLVALEAVSAGTPVLVSDRSGFGELLREVLPEMDASRHVVPVTRDLEEDGKVWAQALDRVLFDREASFRRAHQLRELLATRFTWAKAVESLLQTIGDAGDV